MLHAGAAAEGAGGRAVVQAAASRSEADVERHLQLQQQQNQVAHGRVSEELHHKRSASPQHPGRGTQVSNCVNLYVSLNKYVVITIKRLQVQHFESDSCEFEHVASSIF